MKTLDELKKEWTTSQLDSTNQLYDEQALRKVIKSRVSKQTSTSFQYFWASFVLQILVYALLTHVIIRAWGDSSILLPAIAGILIFIPFTILLMKKFKAMATASISNDHYSNRVVKQYITKYYDYLSSFYQFKKRYELILIPAASWIGVMIVFKLYVPGGISASPEAAIVTFVLTLISCAWAIRNENKKSFVDPLRSLEGIIHEFNE